MKNGFYEISSAYIGFDKNSMRENQDLVLLMKNNIMEEKTLSCFFEIQSKSSAKTKSITKNKKQMNKYKLLL